MDWTEFKNAKPRVQPEILAKLLEERYNLPGVVRRIKNLHSNQVYAVDVSCKNAEGGIYVVKLICKILSSTYTKYLEEVKYSTTLMSFLNEKGLNGQVPVVSKKGEVIEVARFPRQTSLEEKSYCTRDSNDSGIFLVRLLTYVDGLQLSQMEQIPNNIIFQMGSQMAKIHLVTQDISIGKALMTQWGSTYVWSLEQMPKVKKILFVIKDPHKKKVVESVTKAFESNVLSIRDELPHGYIHGDCRGDNCFFQQSLRAGQLFLTNLIDFDDAAYSCLVYDVAISVKYLLTRQNVSDWDSANNVTNFIQGYQIHRLLSQKENGALYYCVCARLVQELVGDLYMSSLSHSHIPYLDQEPTWELLGALWPRGRKKFEVLLNV